MKELLEAGVHFGHQTRRWNPKMKEYIFGERNGIHIIDLQKTLKMFRDASRFVSELASQGRVVLFVGTKRQAQEAVAEEANRCGMFYVNHRWLGGTLTNWATLQKSIKRLKTLKAMIEDGRMAQLSKKEAARLDRELKHLKQNLSGVENMSALPDAMFVIDSHSEAIAVREARRMGVPVVSIVDTNCDPDQVDWVIPGNDDALRAIKLFTSKISDAVIEGRQAYERTQIARGGIRGGLLLGDLRSLICRAAFAHGVGNLGGKQFDRAQRVVIARNHPVHLVRIAIGVHDGNHGNSHAARFANRNRFRIGIDDEHGVRQSRHIFDTRQVLLQMLQFAVQASSLFLGELRHPAVFGHGLQCLQALDGLLEGGPIRQRATQPAMIDVEHAAAVRFLRNRFLCLALCSQEKDGLAAAALFAHKAGSLAKQLQCLLQINDVDSIAFAENILLHLRIPAAGLMAEMNSSLQQFLHRYFNCQSSSSGDRCLQVPDRSATPEVRNRTSYCRLLA